MAEKASVECRYVVLQWNDYRKENFLCFVGGFSSLERASEVQMRCLQGFQEKGWISRLSRDNDQFGRYGLTSVNYPIRERSLKPDTNLVSRKFIQCGDFEEPEAFTVDIHKVKAIEELYIETFWGGWAGRCTVSVGEKIPDEFVFPTFPSFSMLTNKPRFGERLEPVLIDLSDPSKVQSEDDTKNQRYDYEKGRIHCYVFKYVPDTEYPILCW